MSEPEVLFERYREDGDVAAALDPVLEREVADPMRVTRRDDEPGVADARTLAVREDRVMVLIQLGAAGDGGLEPRALGLVDKRRSRAALFAVTRTTWCSPSSETARVAKRSSTRTAPSTARTS